MAMSIVTLLLVGYILSIAAGFNENFKIVQTEYGSIRGKLESTIIDKIPFYAFRGISYAEAPVGELRFKSPKPPTPWSTIKDAFTFGNECIQYSFMTDRVFGSEDCLFLNVFVPENLSSNGSLPVMVFIHGGAFAFGSGDGHAPDFLINHNVILVTLNYRLGPFGFLSLDTPEYSGNMGLKDQLAAIKWVNRNIENFGGNNQKITIFGHSAGSASTEYHTLSPASEGLFQNAIFQSGSALCSWGLGKSHLESMYKFGQKFGRNLTSIFDVIDFLGLVDPNILVTGVVNNAFNGDPASRNPNLIWLPVEEVSNAIDPFLLTDPDTLIQIKPKFDVNIMTGYTLGEMYFLTIKDYVNPELLKPFDKTLDIMMPWRDLKYSYGSKEYTPVANEIRNFYFHGEKIDKSRFFEYNQLLSDSIMTYKIQKSAVLHSQRATTGKVFNYIFSLESKLNLYKSAFGQLQLDHPEASHGDDLCYLFFYSIEFFQFPELYKNLDENSIELKGIRLMTKLWTNFAKFGTPTLPNDAVQFLNISEKERNFVTITNDGLVQGLNPIADKIKFWDTLYERYILRNTDAATEKVNIDENKMGQSKPIKNEL